MGDSLEPVFTLQWPEYLMALRLQKYMPKTKGYSVLIPASRQEKGIDLAVIRKRKEKSRVLTIQIKASRTYIHEKKKRKIGQQHKFHTWFNRFEVSPDANYYLLVGIYAPDAGRTRKVGSDWYKDCTLLFSNSEMKNFLKSVLTRKGNPDQMFGFEFSDDKEIVQSRGDRDRGKKDFSPFLFSKRIAVLKKALRS
jgi:hypothetical protein